jgi:mannitol 2-dehydrogenase
MAIVKHIPPDDTAEAVVLSQATLDALKADVGRPAYDRSTLTAGILHIGVGNFHRAHQAVYLDRLFNKGLDHDWGLVGAGIKPFDTAMREKLAAQDWLTTVVELGPGGPSAHVTGAMVDFVDVNTAALMAALIRPEIRIVSLTITEGGYFVDAATGGFDHLHPEIIRDIANPKAPETVFGILIRALRLRRDTGIAPFTILSCDNLPDNGRVTRQTVVGLARKLAPDIAGWIEETVAFPSSMVDCITPATTDGTRQLVRDRFGIIDQAPVACEPFRQWVMEDHFPGGRPRLEEVGVEFVDDVAPYELMKLRILNAGHAAIAYPSALLGYEAVDEAMSDPDISGWLEKLTRTEILPVLPPSPGLDPEAYRRTCAERFANPAVGDKVARLCADGSNRQPKFILPTVIEALEAGRSVDGLALEIALWCRYCAAIADGELDGPYEDERWPQLQAAALKARHDPPAFLALTDIFGDLGKNGTFGASFEKALVALQVNGVRDTLKAYLGDRGV